MKKIVSVEIENFQSHKHTFVEFSDFTSIVGPSNSGKTAIVRAIRWALFNSPAGTSFITRGSSRARVCVKFDDTTSVTRTRSETENQYILSSPEQGDVVLEHFGMGSVDEVVKFHGIRELDLFGEKEPISICGQLDRPFFISEPDVVKAAMIGKLAGTDKIDYAIKEATSDARAERKKRKELNEELKETKKELKELSGIEKRQKKLEKGEELLTNCKQFYEIQSQISRLSEQKRISELELKSYESALAKESEIYLLDELFRDLENLSPKYQKINSVLQTLRYNQTLLENSEQELKENDLSAYDETLSEHFLLLDQLIPKTEKIKSVVSNLSAQKSSFDLASYESREEVLDKIRSIKATLCEIDDLFPALKEQEQINQKLLSSYSDRQDTCSEINQKEKELEKFREEYFVFLIKSGKCPTCLGEITPEQARKIIEEGD